MKTGKVTIAPVEKAEVKFMCKYHCLVIYIKFPFLEKELHAFLTEIL